MSPAKALPVDHPVAWSSEAASSLARALGDEKRPTKVRRLASSPSSGRGRMGRRADVAGALSERDWAVLTSVALHRFLTTRQVEQFHFHDHASALSAARTARRVLRRLAAVRVLDPLARRVGGVRAGSTSYVWRVGPLGHRLLRSRAITAGTQRPRSEPGLRFLEHCLAVADVHLELVSAERAGALELSEVHLEPAAWRTYLGPAGERLTLKPDLFAVTAVGDYEDHWFLEVDRGTESLPTLLRQCRQYETYRRSGQQQEQSAVFPLVVWIVPEGARKERLSRALRAAGDLTVGLYRVVLPGELRELVSGGAA